MRLTTLLPIAALLAAGVLQAQKPPTPPTPPAPPEPPSAPTWALSGPTRTEQRNETLQYGSKLWVKNRNGGIKVTGWDKEEVALTALIRDSERRKVELVLKRLGADLDIEAVFQQPSWSFGFVTSPRCEMTLKVPRKVLGFFHTTNGSVVASNMEGYARCETTNGDVKLRDIKGEVQAESTNGSIEAVNLKARIKGGTTNGRLVIDNVEGGIVLETTNGGISAKNLDGWGEGIKLESTNGGIDVELGLATGDILLDNTNGSLEINIPGAQIIEKEKHSAHIKRPGKTQRIELNTTNGHISIK
ncbi:MAG: DUF4097 family beta strand repeat protein [Holophagaceae bacterium]|nr:DUF4097 family beta strand repeat protein [Holophagaceae bacterium]